MHPEGTQANLSNLMTEMTVKEFQRSYEDIVLSALKIFCIEKKDAKYKWF